MPGHLDKAKKPTQKRVPAKGSKSTTKRAGFPDLSGDGKTTMKDILIGRGVIKKGDKKMQKKTAMKRGGMAKKKRVKAIGRRCNEKKNEKRRTRYEKRRRHDET